MAPTFAMPVPSGTPITQGFHPGHEGIDYGVPVGTPIQATAGGTVTQAANTDPGGYGNEVDIDHGGGWSSRYGHLSAFAVQHGQTVQQGSVIGASGGAPGAPGAGNATGPHLHFEIRCNGVAQDPAPLVAGNVVGRLTSVSGDIGNTIGGVAGGLTGGLTDPLSSLSLGDLLQPITDLITQLPADVFKVLTGGHSVTEIAIRTLELIAGGVLLAVSGVMLVKIAVMGTSAERAAKGIQRQARPVVRAARRPASVRRPARPVGRQAAPGARTTTRAQNRARRPATPRRPPRGRPRREYVPASDVEVV